MRYEEYKSTDLFWLPEIPRKWEWRFLSQAATEQKIKKPIEEMYPVLTLTYGEVKRKKNINEGLVPETYSNYQMLYTGNIVMRLIDLQNDHTSLRTGLVKETGIITSAYTCLQPLDNSAYLCYLLHSYDTKKIFYGFGGGVRQSIGYKDIRNLKIPVPPRTEQDQIVRYLDWQVSKINKLIVAKKKEIALLEELKRSVIFCAVIQGLNPNVKVKDSGANWIGAIPKHWSITKVKKHFYIENGSDPIQSGNIPVYGSGACSFKTCGEYKVGPTVLLGRKGATLNIPHYIIGKYWNVDTAFNTVSKPGSLFDMKLFYYISTLFDYNYYITQTTLPSMTQSNYKNIAIPYPPSKEQQQIVAYLDEQTKKISFVGEKKQREIDALHELRTRIISDVVTGQIDVRGIEVPDFEMVEEIDESADEEEILEESEEQEE